MIGLADRMFSVAADRLPRVPRMTVRIGLSEEARAIERGILSEIERTLTDARPPGAVAAVPAADILSRARRDLEAVEEDAHMYQEGAGNDTLETMLCTLRGQAALARLDACGVRHDDVVAWFDRPPLERHALITAEHALLVASFRSARRRCFPAEHAARFAVRRHPRYACNAQTIRPRDRDPLLPRELAPRVAAYRRTRVAADPRAWMAELSSAASFNARVWREIHSGEI